MLGSELDLSLSRGLWSGLGASVTVPLRVVRNRIAFEDLSRQTYTPPNPDTHHRNETLTHVADPEVAALLTVRPEHWTLSSRVGTSIPLGKTEPNPFALGRQGIQHQHIQFGTGTFDPVLDVLAMRELGDYSVSASGFSKWTLYENDHGYRAGNWFNGLLEGSRKLGTNWGASAGFSVYREEAERWDGVIEEEGNLGRTDLFAQLGASLSSVAGGTAAISVEIPIKTWATGEQLKYPLIVSLSWSR